MTPRSSRMCTARTTCRTCSQTLLLASLVRRLGATGTIVWATGACRPCSRGSWLDGTVTDTTGDPAKRLPSGPTRLNDPHGDDRDQRPGRVDADVHGRWVAPGHEPLVELVGDRVEDRERQGPRPRPAPGGRGREGAPRQ